MRDLIRIVFISGIILIFFSCKKDNNSLSQSDSAIRYRYFNLQNQGWKSKNHLQTVDNISFTATEVPIQYYLLKDLGNTDVIKVDSIYEENKRERVIEFVFEEKDQKDLLQEEFTHLNYKNAVEYMSFKIQNDFKIVTSAKDTINCTGAIFERSFKIAPYNKLLLFFSNVTPEDKVQLIYQDNLFKKGTLKFRFKEPILNL
ncbi:hypothetical protein [Flavobacterium capsici]|uniref:Uncharacterized protein n=1 Tax=Flavobacterium capsici TaxID=3075618 RepID=A0AA96F0U3_9FLAO|nr:MULTISPECIES: hypothetical protein [unclassified Flavobacterium]WNM19469.1 hypothetical protein RN608_02020 [Flavobacterium sp. PMR2A8]WNM20858.1 hypothetical protein RN605_09190 [Flavobacterium sp. PMTSA4]